MALAAEKTLVNYFLRKNTALLIAGKILEFAIDKADFASGLSSQKKNNRKKDAKRLIENYLKDLLLQHWNSYSKTLSVTFKGNFFERNLFPAICRTLHEQKTNIEELWKSTSVLDYKKSFLTALATSIGTNALKDFPKNDFYLNVREIIYSFHPDPAQAKRLFEFNKQVILRPHQLLLKTLLTGLVLYNLYNLIHPDDHASSVIEPQEIPQQSTANKNLLIYGILLPLLGIGFFSRYSQIISSMLKFIKMLRFTPTQQAQYLSELSTSIPLEEETLDGNQELPSVVYAKQFTLKKLILDELEVLVSRFSDIIEQQRDDNKTAKDKGKFNKPNAVKRKNQKEHDNIIQIDEVPEAPSRSFLNTSQTDSEEKSAKLQRHLVAEARREEHGNPKEQVSTTITRPSAPLPKNEDEVKYYAQIDNQTVRVYPFSDVFVAELKGKVSPSVQSVFDIGRSLPPGDLGRPGLKIYNTKFGSPEGAIDAMIKVKNGEQRIPCTLSQTYHYVIGDDDSRQTQRLVYVPQIEAPKYKLDIRGFIPK